MNSQVSGSSDRYSEAQLVRIRQKSHNPAGYVRSLHSVYPEIGKFGRDRGARKILLQVPEGNALGVHMVDISRIQFFAQQKYRANWPFLDGHYLLIRHGKLDAQDCKRCSKGALQP